MSILTERLPETVVIGDREYKIYTDFRVWIRFSQIAFTEQQGTVSFAKMLALVICDGEACPPLNKETLWALMNFYSNDKGNNSSDGHSSGKRQFDYDFDAGRIYAAFMQQYNIDLTQVDMHWWLFKTLFDGISEETHFGKILQYRGMKLSDVKNKEMRKHYERMKRVYAIPDNRSEKEKERDFAEGLANVF